MKKSLYVVKMEVVVLASSASEAAHIAIEHADPLDDVSATMAESIRDLPDKRGRRQNVCGNHGG